MNIRTGIGYDVHRLVPARKLFLGGVEIPFHLGLEGHSDADVVLHAICDAILGAAGLGDIGEHFSNTDHQFKDISSIVLLERVYQLMINSGYKLINLDVVVLAQEPKISAYKVKMIECISRVLYVTQDAVNIKATTNEGLGFIGKGEGIASYATVLLNKV
jgi:2-C-methyl-D-erythritol 2,4-cyclodiphosphate synthase